MPVRVRCQCGQSLTLPEQRAGLRVTCPVCNEYVTIPDRPGNDATQVTSTATTAVQTPAVAVAVERKPKKPARAKAKSRDKADGEAQPAKPAKSNKAKEKPLASPPLPAPPRPEPRVAKPRAAPQPPPRKPQPTAKAGGASPAANKPSPASDDSRSSTPNPPPRPATAKPAPTPPPLPKTAAMEMPVAPVVAVPITPPPAAAPRIPAVPPPIPAAPPPVPAAPSSTIALSEKVEAIAIQPAVSAATTAAAETKPQPAPAQEKSEPARGVEHDPAKRLTVYQLGFGLAALALASAYPAAAEIVRHVRDPLSPGVENWTYLLLLLCGVQLAYALYLVQLPDWSSVWVTMIVTAIVAMFYAVGMGMSLMAQPDNEVIASLGLTQLHAGGYLSLWCFLLTMLTALLSYSMVRTSVKWHKMFELAMSHAGE